jgi:predicted nucleic acid-binding protein
VAENLGKVVIDTNVLISAVVFGGAPGRVLDLVRTGVRAAEALALEIVGFTEVMAVERAVGMWVDPGDDAIVETALAAGATHVATGDQMLLRTRLPGLRIVTVDTLLGLLRDRAETRQA